ncbi:MAG: UbiA family prenyltransferase [Acidimicrobiia bacterium]|nr:UbiA family prenyltransferase [Acidimicrobiia bacterium]
MAFAWLWGFVNLLSAVLAVAACLFYVFVYTLWLKRTSSQNIVIGGAAGAVPVLIGWAAVRDSLDWAPIVLFAVIFYWTPPHFWALAIKYKDDYSRADVPMLPSVASLRTTALRILGYTVLVVGSHAPLRRGGGHGLDLHRGGRRVGRRLHAPGAPPAA